MPDFWRDSGFHLLNRGDNGRLVVTDDFLRAYLMRPELRPVEDSDDAERALHAELMAEPRRQVPEDRLAGLSDPDARDNYRVLLGFRDRLVRAATVEDCYMALFLEDRVPVPPLFVDQMVHVILRNVLDGSEDGLRCRAGELLFRAQKVTVNDGAVMVADAETVDMYATTGGFGSLGRLVAEAQTPLATIELDVLDEKNADLYWGRDQRYDTVLDLSFARPGLDALCRVLEAWVAHFLEVACSIDPVQRITDERWVWHVGLDSESTAILNDLYQGAEVGEDRLERILSLFRIDFADPEVMLDSVAGRPVYMAMAMTPDRTLRLKPQNLLVNLPLVERA